MKPNVPSMTRQKSRKLSRVNGSFLSAGKTLSVRVLIVNFILNSEILGAKWAGVTYVFVHLLSPQRNILFIKVTHADAVGSDER